MFGFIIGTLSLIGFIKVARGGRFGWRRGGPRRWVQRRLFESLDTTPGQEKVIAQAMEDVERRMWQSRDQLFRSRSQFAAALRSETFDTARVNETFEQQQAAIDDVKKALREGLQSIHEALTPEQRARLADLVEFGPQRMHGHWGHHHFRHASGPGGSAVHV